MCGFPLNVLMNIAEIPLSVLTLGSVSRLLAMCSANFGQIYKLAYMLSKDNIRATGRFINQIFDKRREILYKPN